MWDEEEKPTMKVSSAHKTTGVLSQSCGYKECFAELKIFFLESDRVYFSQTQLEDCSKMKAIWIWVYELQILKADKVVCCLTLSCLL